jgi:hypothetical protein
VSTLLRCVLAYLGVAISLYWSWRFAIIVMPRLSTDDPYLRGVYGNIGLLSCIIWVICSFMCYFGAGAIENTMLRLAVISLVGAIWGAILFINFYYGWLGYDRYAGRIFW